MTTSVKSHPMGLSSLISCGEEKPNAKTISELYKLISCLFNFLKSPTNGLIFKLVLEFFNKL